MATALSIKELKQELTRMQIDFTGCSEKSELVALHEAATASTAAAATSPSAEAHDGTPIKGAETAAEAAPIDDADMDASLAQLSNLLDTLPGSLTLLDKKWSETRQDKVRGQLRTVKALLDQTAAAGSQLAGWQSRLEEYNEHAKAFKRIRDLPRNMNG